MLVSIFFIIFRDVQFNEVQTMQTCETHIANIQDFAVPFFTIFCFHFIFFSFIFIVYVLFECLFLYVMQVLFCIYFIYCVYFLSVSVLYV